MTVHGSWTLDRLVEAYTQHQQRTRGLRPQTLRSRARLVRMLVRAALGEDPVESARLAAALSTLGLRPGEVADLRLDDIDWRGGTIEVRTRKNRRGALLPLPCVVGQALVDYLGGERPATDERRVFVQLLGARRGKPISSTAFSGVVVRALRRAAVDTPLAGAYVFRHTVASRMVQKGASLKEVADVLGHRSLDTTAIYAKLDLPTLREVALPWPGGAPMTPPSFDRLVLFFSLAGSPRRGRGTPLDGAHLGHDHRFIPARAGRRLHAERVRGAGGYSPARARWPLRAVSPP